MTLDENSPSEVTNVWKNIFLEKMWMIPEKNSSPSSVSETKAKDKQSKWKLINKLPFREFINHDWWMNRRFFALNHRIKSKQMWKQKKFAEISSSICKKQQHRPKVIWLMPSPAAESILPSFCLIGRYVNTSNRRVDCAVNYSSNL